MARVDGVNIEQGVEWRWRDGDATKAMVSQLARGRQAAVSAGGGASRSTTYRLKAALTRASRATGRFLPPP